MKQTILSNVRNGITLKELSLLTGKSERQVGNMIKLLINEGYKFKRSIYTDGTIKYELENGLISEMERINYTLDTVSVGLIADIHIGRDNDGIDNLYKAIEYFKENDIHIVFILGDILEGVTYFESSKYPDGESQLERFFKLFPYNSNMVYFYIKGNHDFSILKHNGLDITNRINNRPDFIDLGYGYGRVALGKSIIGLKHDLLLSKPSNFPDDDIVIRGHSHRFEFLSDVLVVPALLEENFYDDTLSAGFLTLTFNMREDYISSMAIKQLAFYRGVKEVMDIHSPVKIKKKI